VIAPENEITPADQAGAVLETSKHGDGSAPDPSGQPDTLQVSSFAHAHDNVPKAITVTWDELAEGLGKPREATCTIDTCGKKCPHKHIGLWSPARYASGATRKKEDVLDVGVLVLDLDHLDDRALRSACERLDAYRCIIHGTHSDRPGDRCLRAVLALTRPVAGADWERFWPAAIAHLGVPADPATCDASRAYFLPSKRADEHNYTHAVNDGAVLDVDAILATAAPPAPAKAVVAVDTPADYPPAAPELLDHVRKRLERHGPAIEGKGGDRHTLVAACIVANDFALSAEEALPLLVAWDAHNVPPWGEAGLREKLRNAARYSSGSRGEERRTWELGRELLAAAGPVQAPAARPSHRPVILITSDQRGVTDEAEAALIASGGVYVRARSLVQVVRDRGGAEFLTRPDGTPVIEVLPRERLRELLGVAADWWTIGKDGNRPVMVPPWVVETLLARGEWKLPPLEGVVDAPVLRPDGTILDVPGYDPTTRLIYDPCGTAFPAAPASPTQADAAAALEELLEPFCDFPFVAESDRAATAALILSIVGRGAYDGVAPIFASAAPAPGSGKGLLVDLCATIAMGRAASKMANTQDDDEVRKRLLSIALESPVLVAIDNVDGAFGTPALAMAITAGTVTDRLLGASRQVTATLRPVWTVTGNNISYRCDLGRRVVPIDLDPGVEHPEDRHEFRHPEVIAYVRENRPRLVIAALTILRAYIAAGRPPHGKPAKGSFESWDRLVRGAIIWSGGADPLAGVERIREQGDADLDNLRALLLAWHAVHGDTPVTIAAVVEDARHAVADDHKRALRTALGAYSKRPDNIDAVEIGYALRRLKGRIVGGLKLDAAKRTKGGVPWRVVGTSTRTKGAS